MTEKSELRHLTKRQATEKCPASKYGAEVSKTDLCLAKASEAVQEWIEAVGQGTAKEDDVDRVLCERFTEGERCVTNFYKTCFDEDEAKERMLT